ncbi:lasso peptide biosynthesis B2 protein [Sediminibacillus massiliensis]|uniref:lasso peptide biosynthesis B2 protein n=1 Tax=Sediminibacillus massiliensis TaxID=1926277 RepID=UPI0009888873|nr:lasso peptide biosynthesis B2 protein [Sediminibacillus massiliensis]
MQKVKLFLQTNNEFKLLLIESYVYLAWARILKCVSFSKVAPSLGMQMQETSFEIDISNEKLIKNVSQAVNLMSRYTFWESQCLVKAIAAMKMLEKRKIESTLYLGTAKDESGKLIAHAWLRSGSFFVTGYEGRERFTIVNKFAKKVWI